MLDLHSTTQVVVSRLHATVLGRSCVVEIGLTKRSNDPEKKVYFKFIFFINK